MRYSSSPGPRSTRTSAALALAAGITLLAGCASEIGDTGASPPDAMGSAGTGAGGRDPSVPGAGTGAGPSTMAPNGGAGPSPGPGAAPLTPDPSKCASDPPNTGASVLRRLSLSEYQRTLQDLFLLPAAPAMDGIPVDVDKDGFKTFAEVQTVSAQHLRAYVDKATELANALFADTARRSKVLGCELSAAGCLRSFVTRFGGLAYRRALDAAEIDALTTRAQANGLDQTDQFRFVIESLLASPSFLHRVEVGNTAEALATLSGPELASRLAFGLWGRAPDAALLEQAAQGALDTEQGLTRAAESMLSDPKAESFFASFFRQWLGFDALRPPTVPPMGWSNALMGAMQAETDALVNEFAWDGKSFFDVLTTNHTRVSRELATFHRLPTPGTDGLIEFGAEHARANTGILTHPSLLSAKSDGDLIALRGNWLRRTFLCQSLHIPAAVQDELGETLVGLTPVQVVEKRNTELACKGCHAMIDPIGVGFSQYDNLGRYDATADLTKYGIAPGLPDAAEPGFASIAELSSKLRALPNVPACLAAKVFIYVNGREAGSEDTCTVENVSRAFVDANQSFPALVKGLVATPAFRLRRAPAAP